MGLKKQFPELEGNIVSVAAKSYYGIPKGKVENLRWRREILSACKGNKRLQRGLWLKCKADPVYWMNGFCWLIEPRPGEGELGHGKIPFITRQVQNRCIRLMRKAWGRQDIGVEKARAEGITWVVLYLILHDFLFGEEKDFPLYGLVSRNEDAVDNPDDPDALMPKLDWAIKTQPRFLLPPQPELSLVRSISRHTLTNKRNGANITGYPATEDVGRGGRKKVWFMDELASFPEGKDYAALASTQHTTKCRIFVSTPNGASGAYYDQMHDDSSNMLKIVLDWKDNPFRNRGMYKCVRGKCVTVDLEKYGPVPKYYRKTFPEIREKLERKGFKVEGTIRSPWYDNECLRPNATPQLIAQELDRDYQGSEFQVFGDRFYNEGMENVLVPWHRCIFEAHPETLEPMYDMVDGGPLRLWCNLIGDRPPRDTTYVVGCDVASGLAGSYSSNSVAVVLDRRTHTQTGVFVSNSVDPMEFADIAMSLCKWFNDALLIWECNGDNGSRFTQQVLDRRYWNIYMREVKFKRFKQQTRQPGFFSDRQTKAAMLGALSEGIKSKRLTIRELEFFRESKEYIFDATGKITHSKSRARVNNDNSAVGEAHGDRVIAMGLAWWAIKDERDDSELPKMLREDDFDSIPTDRLPYGSMAWRLRRVEEHARRQQLIFEP